MPNKRDLRLGRYGIDENAFRELKYYCLQYHKKKQDLTSLRDLKIPKLSDMPRGTGISDTTGRSAILAAQKSSDCETIEQCALEVGGMFYPWLLDGVTIKNCDYRAMDRDEFYRGRIPIGKKKYYKMRRQFYWLLAIKKGVI